MLLLWTQNDLIPCKSLGIPTGLAILLINQRQRQRGPFPPAQAGRQQQVLCRALEFTHDRVVLSALSSGGSVVSLKCL